MNTETSVTDLASKYTPGEIDVINQLREIQSGLALSDAAFGAKHLTVAATTWYRIKAGSYNADASAALLKLERDLRNYRIELAQASRLLGSKPYHRLTPQQSVFDAVTTCKLKPAEDPNRFVAYLAPTGGGKTTLGRNLKIQHNGILVEGRESWRRSYLAALCDIAKAAGVREVESLVVKGEHAVETEVLAKLTANRRVLIIDEGEYFGPRTINLVKLILNQTPTVVVVLAIPQLYDWWQRKAWEQAKQINRRAEAVIVSNEVLPEDVKTFLVGAKIVIEAGADQKPGVALNDACRLIAEAANQFGSYDTVDRVMQALENDYEGCATVTDVAAAINATKKLLNRRS